MRLVSYAGTALLAFGLLPTAANEWPDQAQTKAVVLGAEYGVAADDFGYIVVDVADGRVVAELNADQTFMPASVIKIPTTTAAIMATDARKRASCEY